MKIYCCGCRKEIDARLTDGKEIYPHRQDLHSLPFWKCDSCSNYVGCHHRHHNKKKQLDPLGVIPTPELKAARRNIHAILDPLWKGNKTKRRKLYGRLSKKLGYEYHTAEIKTAEEARKVYQILQRYEQKQ